MDIKFEMTGNFDNLTSWLNKAGSSQQASSVLNDIGKDPFKVVFLIFSFVAILALYFSFKDIKEIDFHNTSGETNKLKKYESYKSFLLISFIFSLISNLTSPVFLLYLQDYITRDLGLITLIFIPASILSIYLPRKFGLLADKTSRKKILLVGILFSAVLQMLIPTTNSYNSFIILYTIISLVGIFYAPAFSSLVIDFVGEDKRGSSYGLYSLASGLGATFGPLVGAFIYEKIGN